MATNKNQRIVNNSLVIVGSGKLAKQFIKHFIQHSLHLKQVISRSNKKKLSKKFPKQFHIENKLSKIDPFANIYLIVVNDDSIKDIVQHWPFQLDQKQVILHCSGSITSNIFEPISENHGVMWPIQSFSNQKKINWKTIPICITANNKFSKNKIKQLSLKLTQKITLVDDDKRGKLHLAAVILNNFSNHLFVLVEEYLVKNDLKFDLLIPIIQETITLLDSNLPISLQTGPAIRGDHETIKKHLKILKKNTTLKTLYQLMSDSIQSHDKRRTF